MDELTAAGITDPRLRASYRECKTLNSRHGKTYYLATLLLPKNKRPYVHALYGFANETSLQLRSKSIFPLPFHVSELNLFDAIFPTEIMSPELS